jgi:hypothetical protein
MEFLGALDYGGSYGAEPPQMLGWSEYARFLCEYALGATYAQGQFGDALTKFDAWLRNLMDDIEKAEAEAAAR